MLARKSKSRRDAVLLCRWTYMNLFILGQRSLKHTCIRGWEFSPLASVCPLIPNCSKIVVLSGRSSRNCCCGQPSYVNRKMQNSNFSLLNSAKLCFKVLKCGKIVSLGVIHSHKIVDVNCVFPPLCFSTCISIYFVFLYLFSTPRKRNSIREKDKILVSLWGQKYWGRSRNKKPINYCAFFIALINLYFYNYLENNC